MIGGHRPCASSHRLEPIRSRDLVKALKHAVVELVDDDTGLISRYEIGRRRSPQGDRWSSARGSLEQDQAEGIAARRYQQKVHGPIHRDEIVAVFVADEVG